MTEEIIIDGIDVSKCEVFFKANKTCYNCYACEGSDCYFKQLKRLEQENRELKAYKDINEDFKKAWDELNEKYKQLRSALEEIKSMTDKFDYWNSNLPMASEIIGEVKDKINEVLE